MASGKQESGSEARDGEGPAAEALAGLRSVVDQKASLRKSGTQKSPTADWALGETAR